MGQRWKKMDEDGTRWNKMGTKMEQHGTKMEQECTHHLPNVPRFIGVETFPTSVGRGGVAQMTVVGPDNDFGVVQMGLNAQQLRERGQTNSGGTLGITLR
jgi:hypothetical protein